MTSKEGRGKPLEANVYVSSKSLKVKRDMHPTPV